MMMISFEQTYSFCNCDNSTKRKSVLSEWAHLFGKVFSFQNLFPVYAETLKIRY